MISSQFLKKNAPWFYRFLARSRFKLARDTVADSGLGFRIYQNRYSYVESLVARKQFEPKRALHMQQLIREYELFIDVGANVGFFSLLAASHGCKTHAFEPDRVNHARLIANIRLNRYEGLVSAERLAVGKESSRLPIFAPASDNYGRISLIADDSKYRTDVVEVVSLDSYMEVPKVPVLIKVDIEGYEQTMLAGASTWVNDVVPTSKWIVEVHTGCGIDPKHIEACFPSYRLSYFNDETGAIDSRPTQACGDLVLIAEKL